MWDAQPNQKQAAPIDTAKPTVAIQKVEDYPTFESKYGAVSKPNEPSQVDAQTDENINGPKELASPWMSMDQKEAPQTQDKEPAQVQMMPQNSWEYQGK